MKNYLQNKINGAIKAGINLGFDLCDVNLNDNSNIEQDLQKRNKEFHKVGIIENANDIVNEYFQKNNFRNVIKSFCCDYCDTYYAIYQNSDIKQLQKLIIKLCNDFGNKINLNWIDVRHINSFLLDYDEKEMPPSIGLFSNTSFNGDISHWDVSHCTEMEGLFAQSHFDGDLSLWDVKNVKNMSSMFAASQFNNDSISHWNMQSVKDMQGMFFDSWFDQDLSRWNVSNVHDMSDMFGYARFNHDISMWDVSSVVTMSGMFYENHYFNQDVSKWDVRNVTSYDAMYYNCHVFEDYKPTFINL